MNFSIIIPAFNERKRLPVFLNNLVKDIKESGLSCEVIIVDDGSTKENYKSYEETLKPIQYFSKNISIKILRHHKNLGKGAAIKTGFKEAKGDWFGFVDADGATPSGEIVRIMKFALSSDRFDGVFGSRIRMLGYSIERKFSRHLFGRIFTSFACILFGIPFYDSQCGCKFFKKDKILPFLNQCEEKGYLFDIELIVIGHLHKLNFIEVPISWKDVRGSKVYVIRDGIKMLAGLQRIKKRLKYGFKRTES